MRSCNDDYVPFTRSTCEPNELEKKNFSNENRACISQYPDANIHFREVKVVIPWLDLEETDARFVPDAQLEALDAKLEAIYTDYEKKLNGSEDDIIRPDFDDETQMILEYVERNKFFGMTIAEAVDYLKSCHHCGNTNIPFGNEYCNERCQDYSVDFSYRCFRGADCKACENYYRHNSFIKYYYEEEVEEEEDLVYDDSGEMTPRGRINTNNNYDIDDYYEELSYSDRFNNDEPCSLCGENKEIIAYGWRDVDDNLCGDCVNLPGMEKYEC
jgi:hypothetical protein